MRITGLAKIEALVEVAVECAQHVKFFLRFYAFSYYLYAQLVGHFYYAGAKRLHGFVGIYVLGYGAVYF